MINLIMGLLQSLRDIFSRTFRYWHSEDHLAFTLADLSILVNGMDENGHTACASKFIVHHTLNNIIKIMEECPPPKKTYEATEFRAIDFIRALKTLNHALVIGWDDGPFYVPQSRVHDLYVYRDVLDGYVQSLKKHAPEHNTCRRDDTDNIFDMGLFRPNKSYIMPDGTQMSTELQRFGLFLEKLIKVRPFVFTISASDIARFPAQHSPPKADIK